MTKEEFEEFKDDFAHEKSLSYSREDFWWVGEENDVPRDINGEIESAI